MINNATYAVNLYLNGTLIGDVRELAQNLVWARRRTRIGVDEIDFTLNDVLFDNWCKERGTDINTMLRPYALECRVVRNGVELVGGFLATMPGYSPRGTSADLALRFDGFLNLLAGVYIYNTSTGLPVGTVTGRMGALVQTYITMANTRSGNAGKGFGFTAGTISTMNSVTHTFDNFKSVKEFITDRCDNTEGAGPFDVYFHADKTYDVLKDDEFGDIINDWVGNYPADINVTSLASISASEVGGFASAIIAIGSGEISSNADENTAIVAFDQDDDATAEYGYAETLVQESSIVRQATLAQKAATELFIDSNPIWQPSVTMNGQWVEPKPTGTGKIWIGDTITIDNREDLTGMTSGTFRVNELRVQVSAAGSETITPTLERVYA